MSPKAAKHPKRAVGYVRISKDRDDETSTTTQEEHIRSYCAMHKWDVVDVVVEPGRSGFKASRSTRRGYGKVKQMVEAGAVDVVVVWKLNRVVRNTIDALTLVQVELAGHGVDLASVTEPFDTTTASGRAVLGMISILGELESATKSENTAAWHGHRRANGGTPTGPRPFGYRREKNTLLIDKDEAAMVRKMARRVLRGDALRSLAAELAADGVVGTNGVPFTRQTLRQLLVNPTIAGCRRTAEKGVYVEGAWKPILDRETWEQVRAVLTDRNRRSGPGNTRRWLLSGIATCGRCPVDPEKGVPPKMGVVSHKSGPRYACPACHLSIEVERTDEVVEHDLLALLDDKAWRRLRQGRRATKGADLAAFEREQEEMIARWRAGDIDGTELDRITDALRRRYEADSAPAPPLPNVADLAKAWPTFTLEQRRLVLMSATESLTIGPSAGRHGFDESRIVWTAVS